MTAYTALLLVLAAATVACCALLVVLARRDRRRGRRRAGRATTGDLTALADATREPPGLEHATDRQLWADMERHTTALARVVDELIVRNHGRHIAEQAEQALREQT